MTNSSDSTAKPNSNAAAQASNTPSASSEASKATPTKAPEAQTPNTRSAPAQDKSDKTGTTSSASSSQKSAHMGEQPKKNLPKTASVTVQPTEPPVPRHEENPWVETVKTIGVSIVLALGLRAAIVEARYIPSGSMLPTLEINDRLIVEKVSYHFNDPERGDIVVFSPTDRLREDNPSLRDAFIKRIIGLPGETIEITNGQVFVDGETIEENYIPEEYAPDYEWGPEVVPEGEYLVLGDNRNNSYDSHFWGYVPKRNIIGRAVIRFWPPQRLGTIDPIPVYLEESNPSPTELEPPVGDATAPQG